jgi:hypothetical protein
MTFRIVQQGRPYCGNGGWGLHTLMTVGSANAKMVPARRGFGLTTSCRDDYIVPAVDFAGGRRVVGRTFLGV